MKRGRAAARARRRALAVALALAVASAAVAPVAPGPASVARAQGGTGVIAHSTKGVLLRAEPDYGAEVLTTVAEGTTVGLRTDAADTVYDPDGVTQWWPVRAGDADGWVAGFYLDIAGLGAAPDAESAADSSSVPAASGSLGGEGATAAEDQFLATGISQTRPPRSRNPTASICGRIQARAARPSRRFPSRPSSSCALTKSTPSTPRGAAGGPCRSMVSLAGLPVSTWRRRVDLDRAGGRRGRVGFRGAVESRGLVRGRVVCAGGHRRWVGTQYPRRRRPGRRTDRHRAGGRRRPGHGWAVQRPDRQSVVLDHRGRCHRLRQRLVPLPRRSAR